MKSTASRQRRKLCFQSLPEIEAEAERWTSGEYEAIGNWSSGQILRHLASSMNCSIDGFGFQASWPVRTFASLVKQSYITKSMKAGFRLPKQATLLLPEHDLSLDAGLAELRAALDRYAHELPVAKHPVFGKMTIEEWTHLHCRHAELHLSFVLCRKS